MKGKKFGEWTVLEFAGTNKFHKKQWKCRCSCGKEKIVLGTNLVNGKSTSCGHSALTDIVGKKFNSWYVDSFAYKRGAHNYYHCTCECGTKQDVLRENLLTGKSKSCGCDLALVGSTVKGIKIKELVHHRTYIFECPYCGKEFEAVYSRVSSGHLKSCGCRSKTNQKVHEGMTFGDLTVLERAGSSNSLCAMWKCKCSCGKEKVVYGYKLVNGTTTSCGHEVVSKGESSVYDFVKTLIPENMITKSKVLDGKEIDIYIPSRNLGIEYNGSMFHASEGGVFVTKDKYYHRDKFVLAKEKGIHLINIFDYAWLDEQEKIKSYLHDLLGETTKIYARKCRWARIEKAEACGFADMYHLQGSTRLQEISYGLYYIDELIAIMSFGKPRYKQSSDIFELQRYCVKFGCHIVGGAERLLKAFEREYKPSKIISYSDNNYFSGNMYSRLGFDFIRYTEPDYVWVSKRDLSVLPRYKCQPKLLKNKYPELYAEVTSSREIYIMTHLGYCKVFGCGNTFWEKVIDK